MRTLVFNGSYLLAGTEAHSILSTQPAAPLQLVNAVSRKAHGNGTTHDLALPLSGTPAVESRSGAAGHTLVVTFSNELTQGSASVTAGAATINATRSGNVMTLDLASVTDAQTLTLTLTNLTDVSGQTLPPTNVRMAVLLGDVSGDGVVNSVDALQTRSRSGLPADAASYRADVNLDGIVNASDQIVVRNRSGNSLP